jgi:DNA-binding NarL/FixJ family response regulator
VLVPIGLFALLIEIHLLNIVSALHAAWARLMLASRARTIPSINAPGDSFPTGPTGGQYGLAPKPDMEIEDPVPGPELTGLASLTRREQDVLGLIARGHSNAEMAEAFVISEGTVKTHVKRVEVRDRTQAAVYAYEIGFVKPNEVGGGSTEPIHIDSYRAG